MTTGAYSVGLHLTLTTPLHCNDHDYLEVHGTYLINSHCTYNPN